MTGKYITFEPELAQQVASLRDCASEMYPSIFQAAVVTLESGVDREQIARIADTAKFDVNMLLRAVQAASVLLWEVTKGLPPKADTAPIQTALQRLGWVPLLAEAFCACFQENRLRLHQLKGSLAISKRRCVSVCQCLPFCVCACASVCVYVCPCRCISVYHTLCISIYLCLCLRLPHPSPPHSHSHYTHSSPHPQK